MPTAISDLVRAAVDTGTGAIRPAARLMSLLAAFVVRNGAVEAVEALVRSPARRTWGIRRSFGDDTVAYFTERLDVRTTRTALATAVRQAKRRKGFDAVVRMGLIVDG